jgi:hypothetical protein
MFKEGSITWAIFLEARICIKNLQNQIDPMELPSKMQIAKFLQKAF